MFINFNNIGISFNAPKHVTLHVILPYISPYTLLFQLSIHVYSIHVHMADNACQLWILTHVLVRLAGQEQHVHQVSWLYLVSRPFCNALYGINHLCKVQI